jgi:ribonuclease HI
LEGLLVIYRKHQVDFKWIKGTIITQNERCDVRCVIMATQSIPLSIDAFMRRKKEKFYENLRV